MQAAKERTHAETTRREFFKLKIILIFLHHIQMIVTRIFNRIRKVTHMTRDIRDIILHPSDSVLVPNGYFFNWHVPTRSLNMNPNLVIPANVGVNSYAIDIHSDGRGRLDTFQAHTVCRVLFRKEIEPSC